MYLPRELTSGLSSTYFSITELNVSADHAFDGRRKVRLILDYLRRIDAPPWELSRGFATANLCRRPAWLSYTPTKRAEKRPWAVRRWQELRRQRRPSRVNRRRTPPPPRY